jgi:hypothetical protein
VQVDRIFTAFAGKASVVHFFRGSFDLAVTRKGVPVPLAAAIFAPIELALVLQSHQFALRAPANRRETRDKKTAAQNRNPQLPPSRWDRARFHRSGNRGRQGLGAGPLHPEGPGNVTR